MVFTKRQFLVIAIMTATLAATAQPNDTKVVPTKHAGEWFGFAAYPGARELCSESLIGNNGREILWYKYASEDKPSQVIAFYVKENGKDKNSQGDAEQTDNTLTLRRGNDVLSVQAAGSGAPSCDRKTRTTEKTVIVVSRLLNPGHP